MKLLNRNKLIIGFILFSIFTSLAASQEVTSNDIQTMRRMAQAFERAGDVEQAANLYIQVTLANPKDISTYLGAQRLLFRMQDFDRLEEFILQLQNKQRHVRYAIDLANIDYKRGNEKDALKKWDVILKENPRNQQAYSLVGRVLVENQRYDEAIELYTEARQTFENETLFIFDLANIYKVLNKTDELLEEYLAFLRTNPTQINYIQNEIRSLTLDEETTQRLIASLKKAQKKHPDSNWAILLFLGDLYSHTETYDLALNSYVELESLLQNSETSKHFRRWKPGQFVFGFAETVLNDKHLDVAEQAFQVLVTEFDSSAFKDQAELGLANVYLLRKDYTQAISALQRFVDANPKSPNARKALMQMGHIYLQQLFNIEQAENAYRTALQAYPNPRQDIFTYFPLYECSIAGNDLNRAESYLQQALKRATGNNSDLRSHAYLRLAYLELYRKRPSVSLQYLDDFNETISENRPNSLENDALELGLLLNENRQDSTSLAVYGQASLFLKQQKYPETQELLEQHLHENPSSLMSDELRLLLIQAYEAQSDYQKAIDGLSSIYNNEQSFYRDYALLTMAEISSNRLSEPETAKQYYEKLLVEFPNSIYLEKARKRIRQNE